MNKNTILTQYVYCKENWDREGKGMLYDAERVERLSSFADALNRILDLNHLSIDTNHGGPVYDNQKSARLVGVVSGDDPNEILGTISFGYNAIGITFITKVGMSEGYSSISFDGENMNGMLSRPSVDGKFTASITFGKEGYRIGEDSYQFGSSDNAGKIVEVTNAVNFVSRVKENTMTK